MIGIIYGALVAWVQPDMKKLVAYSSVAHLGFVMLGLLAFDLVAWQGALLQMVNHGLSTGALFLLVGMLYDRRHTKKFEEFGGLAKVDALVRVLPRLHHPRVGRPAGAQRLRRRVPDPARRLAARGYRLLVAIATFGVVLAAVYLLKMLQETLWGPITQARRTAACSDLDGREIAALVPLCVLMLWIGVAPRAFLEPSRPALASVLAEYRARLEAAPVTVPGLSPPRGDEATARTFVASAPPARQAP